MGRARAEVVIERDADVVWTRIADFSDPSWIPDVEDFRMCGEHERVLTMSGMELIERQLRRDDERRMVTYALIAGDLRLDHHEASITVTACGSKSWVCWDVDTDDRVLEALRRGYERVLEALKADLEG